VATGSFQQTTSAAFPDPSFFREEVIELSPRRRRPSPTTGRVLAAYDELVREGHPAPISVLADRFRARPGTVKSWLHRGRRYLKGEQPCGATSAGVQPGAGLSKRQAGLTTPAGGSGSPGPSAAPAATPRGH